jgi:hypothetical protein
MSESIPHDLRMWGATLAYMVALLKQTAMSTQKADASGGSAAGADMETIFRVAAAAGLGTPFPALDSEAQAAEAKPAESVPPAAHPATKPPYTLRCAKHGASPWVGTIACDRCGRVFQALVRGAPWFASECCPCGARLKPGTASEPFSAMPICMACFTKGIAASGGPAAACFIKSMKQGAAAGRAARATKVARRKSRR